jgi:hypothetical protein
MAANIGIKPITLADILGGLEMKELSKNRSKIKQSMAPKTKTVSMNKPATNMPSKI